mmetsp:Transcript_65468/g.95914  ORF Transcript_65468/g.95914 Transcript_65468/m.95914 type:complete len:84 (+) Transcript_65468:887-1138(+)
MHQGASGGGSVEVGMIRLSSCVLVHVFFVWELVETTTSSTSDCRSHTVFGRQRESQGLVIYNKDFISVRCFNLGSRLPVLKNA